MAGDSERLRRASRHYRSRGRVAASRDETLSNGGDRAESGAELALISGEAGVLVERLSDAVAMEHTVEGGETCALRTACDEDYSWALQPGSRGGGHLSFNKLVIEARRRLLDAHRRAVVATCTLAICPARRVESGPHHYVRRPRRRSATSVRRAVPA